MNCGCTIETHSRHPRTVPCNRQVCPDSDGFWIEFCPLHAHAEELRDSLKLEHYALMDESVSGGFDAHEEHEPCPTCKLLADANGGKA